MLIERARAEYPELHVLEESTHCHTAIRIESRCENDNAIPKAAK